MSVSVNVDGVRKRIMQLKDPNTFDSLCDSVAHEVHGKLVSEWTPRKWTGKTRQAWLPPVRGRTVNREIVNRSVVMAYLDRGTGATRGGYIYPRVKKALFIPLTYQASMFARNRASWGEFEGGDEDGVDRGGSVTYVTDKGNVKTKRLTYGVDYVLAKRVRGIKPKRIAQKAQEWGQARLVQELDRVLRKVIGG